jgi:hypothetical protein
MPKEAGHEFSTWKHFITCKPSSELQSGVISFINDGALELEAVIGSAPDY